MPRAIDVARYLLKLSAEEPEPDYLSHMRLQKLLYYVQGWSLGTRDRTMFASSIQAWRHGPVVREVWPMFADYRDSPIPFKIAHRSTALSADERAFVTSVWRHYGRYTASELWRMTHAERPWREVWGDRGEDGICEEEITHDSMKSFFREEYERQQIPGLELDRLRQADAALKLGRGVPLTEVLPKLRNAL